MDETTYSTSNIRTTDVDISARPSRLSLDGQRKLVKDEEIELGRVSWRAMKLGLRAFGGNNSKIFIAASFLGLLIAQSATSFQSWFLGYWGEKSKSGQADNFL